MYKARQIAEDLRDGAATGVPAETSYVFDGCGRKRFSYPLQRYFIDDVGHPFIVCDGCVGVGLASASPYLPVALVVMAHLPGDRWCPLLSGPGSTVLLLPKTRLFVSLADRHTISPF